VTHNFIDKTLVSKRVIYIKDFEGFNIVVDDGYNMTCIQRFPWLEMSFENYTLTDEFYVVDLENTNVFLGVQWVYSLGKFSMKNQLMEMEFKGEDGRKIVMRGMTNGSPRIVSSK